MKKYIISPTSNGNFLLAEFCDVASGLDEAEDRARDLTSQTLNNHFVFEVDIKHVSSARIIKNVEVLRRDAPK